MKIHKIRYGFATNSSSSHSVVLAPGLTDNYHTMSFGWENFVLASREAKRRYLFAAAFHHHRKSMSPAEAATLAAAVFPVEEADVYAAVNSEGAYDIDCYIDHQSAPHFPEPRRPETGMRPLWELLDREIVQNDKVAILGGNDNQDNEAWKPKAAAYAPRLAIWEDLSEANGCVFGIDEETGHFTLFGRTDGKKIRVLPEGVDPPERAVVPELVDIKITNYCERNCPYCYQRSSKKGKHASTGQVLSFATFIGNMGVFEVAIGGGEPTEHPDFPRILRAFRSNGVVPNFSTQSWSWFDKPEIVMAVSDCCGAVALSTQVPEQAVLFMETCKDRDIKAHIHYVLGLSPLDNLKKMLQRAPRGYIVLLAYKEMGRAAGKPPLDYTGWQDVVRNNTRGWTVAVDSFLVDEVELGFTRDEVPARLFEATDGRFSFYWDAVKGSYAAHSFKPPAEHIHYGEKSAEKVAEAWVKLSGAKRKPSIWR